MYLLRKNEASSRNHCSREKATSITYLCVCVCVRVCARVKFVGECTGVEVCLRASSLANPACNVPSYWHLRPLWLHDIFPHYLINGTIFGKKVI